MRLRNVLRMRGRYRTARPSPTQLGKEARAALVLKRADPIPSAADGVGLHCRPLSRVPIPPAMSAAWAWGSPVWWLVF